MSIRDLIDAIHSGDALAIENNFDAVMAEKIAARIEDKRMEVAKGMFSGEQVEETPEEMVEESVDLESLSEEQLEEVLKKSDPAGKWISDFVHSDNPKFAGKSKKERIKMALGAYYAKHPEKSNK